jgi:hypothetical protein
MPRRHRVALLTLFLPPDPSPDERAAGARNHGFLGTVPASPLRGLQGLPPLESPRTTALRLGSTVGRSPLGLLPL